MEESEVEIVRDPDAVYRIFELMLERRKALRIIQHGHRSDAWVVKVSSSRLVLAKRDKALNFTTEAVEFQFRCALGRNIVGKSRILRLKDDYLELVLPDEVTIIQRRHAYRVVPTAESVAIFLTAARRILSGRIENISSRGILVRLPQATPVVVPSDVQAISFFLNHAPPTSDNTPPGKLESLRVNLKAATIARKGDKGTTKFATYGLHFTPTIAEERQLAQVILRYERAARLKGIIS